MNVHFTLLLASRASLLLHHFSDTLEKAWIMPNDLAVMKKTLSEALLARPSAPISLLLDGEGLDLFVDSLPPASGWQRQKLMNRQCDFHFPNAPLAGSAQIGKDGPVLHVALEAGAALQKTLDSVYGIGNPSSAAGFYALECANTIAAMPNVPQHPLTLLLIAGEATGLRQILVKDGVPVFTRLHPECVPSMPASQFAKLVSEHVQSTRDYMPRLNLGADVQVQLFVPPICHALGSEPLLKNTGATLIVLEGPKSELVPPEWALDLALLSRIAAGGKRLVPFTPETQKSHGNRLVIRQDVSIVMFVFGVAGIAFGLNTLFGSSSLPPPPGEPLPLPAKAAPAAAIATVPPPAEPDAPALKLDAFIFNSPTDWAAWINGEKYTPDHMEGGVTILDVKADAVHVRWQHGGKTKDFTLGPNGNSPTLPENEND